MLYTFLSFLVLLFSLEYVVKIQIFLTSNTAIIVLVNETTLNIWKLNFYSSANFLLQNFYIYINTSLLGSAILE